MSINDRIEDMISKMEDTKLFLNVPDIDVSAFSSQQSGVSPVVYFVKGLRNALDVMDIGTCKLVPLSGTYVVVDGSVCLVEG